MVSETDFPNYCPCGAGYIVCGRGICGRLLGANLGYRESLFKFPRK